MDLFSKAVEKIGAIIGIVSSLSVALGVVYDLGYFSVVGKKFFTFLSLSDHLTSAIWWLPIVFSTIPLFMLAHVSSETLRDTPKSRHKTLLTLSSSFPASFLLAFILIFSGGTDGLGKLALFILIFLSSLAFTLLFFNYALVRRLFEALEFPFVVLTVVAVSLVAVAIYGAFDAREDIDRPSGDTIQVRTTSAPDKSFNLIRAFSGGVLVTDPVEKKVLLFKSDSIVSVEEANRMLKKNK